MSHSSTGAQCFQMYDLIMRGKEGNRGEKNEQMKGEGWPFP